ncbi:MAG: histidine kinase dimerization/phospho-acceptor domain-containing protein [Dehalococcoidales bacterium]|jgi:hypothetical protein
MAYKNSARLELETTAGKRLRTAPPAVTPPASVPPVRPEKPAEIPVDVAKTVHDLRASLNIVIGFTELILDETMGKINPEQRRSLNDVLSNGQRLLGLSDQIIKRLGNLPENRK